MKAFYHFMEKEKISSVSEIKKQLKQKKLLPIYFLFGEDEFALKETVDLITKYVSPLVTIEFDKQIFFGNSNTIDEVIGFSLAFPFGSEKKLAIVKEFEKIKEPERLLSYIQKPVDFTVLLLVYSETIKKFENELFKLLIQKGYIFEAKELRDEQLVSWLKDYCSEKGKTLSDENAVYFIELAGSDRNLIEMQINKIISFMKDEKVISYEIIKEQIISSREYSIFDLFNAIGNSDKSKAFTVANKILEQEEITMIIAMLNKYFSGIAQVPEMTKTNVPDQTAARVVGSHPYYYKDYKNAANKFTSKKLIKISRALLQSDIEVKTSSIDHKTILNILLTKIFNA